MKRKWHEIIEMIFIAAAFFALGYFAGMDSQPKSTLTNVSQNNENTTQLTQETQPVQGTQKADGRITEGEYIVGKEMPAGEYKLINGSKGGYYEIKESSSSNARIITNGLVEGQKYITVKDGEYFEFRDCNAYKVSN